MVLYLHPVEETVDILFPKFILHFVFRVFPKARTLHFIQNTTYLKKVTFSVI